MVLERELHCGQAALDLLDDGVEVAAVHSRRDVDAARRAGALERVPVAGRRTLRDVAKANATPRPAC